MDLEQNCCFQKNGFFKDEPDENQRKSSEMYLMKTRE